MITNGVHDANRSHISSTSISETHQLSAVLPAALTHTSNSRQGTIIQQQKALKTMARDPFLNYFHAIIGRRRKEREATYTWSTLVGRGRSPCRRHRDPGRNYFSDSLLPLPPYALLLRAVSLYDYCFSLQRICCVLLKVYWTSLAVVVRRGAG